MAKKFVAALLLCMVAIAAVHILKAEAVDENQFRDCYSTCHKECFNDGSGNGFTFCEMKCDADCAGKEIKGT